MGRRILLVAVAVGLIWLYRFCLIGALGLATAMPFPLWWPGLFPARGLGIFSWALLWHTAAALAVAVPFAWVIARYYGRLGIYLASAMTLLFVAPDLPSLIEHFGSLPRLARAADVFDVVKLLVALPLFVWLFQGSPSNYRLDRTGGAGGFDQR